MHSHGHHGHHHAGKVLRFSVVATVAYIGLTLVVGIRANSLALISEAGHNLSDLLALLLSWVALWFQSRPPDSLKTYGYHRAGVLAAFVNALGLIVIAGFIFWEAFERFRHPAAVQPKLMMIVAGVGVVMNGLIALAIYRTSRDVNMRSVLVHEIGDTVSTAAVIIGGWLILAGGPVWIDAALSIAIGGLILWSSFGIIRETLNILLEGTPRGMKLDDICNAIKNIDGVDDVHDLHVWSIGSEVHALSCHVRIADLPLSASNVILRNVEQELADRFHIHHTTIQFEHAQCEVEHGCVMPTQHGHGHELGHRH